MKSKILNVLAICLFIWALISAGYLALPNEYKEMLPDFNWLTALVGGASSGLLGSAIIYIKGLFKNQDDKNAEKLLMVVKVVENLTNKLDKLETEIKEGNRKQVDNSTRTNKLLEGHLNAKLSSNLLDEKVAEIIEGVLSEK